MLAGSQLRQPSASSTGWGATGAISRPR
jgi:hypothetical protein